MPSKPACVFFWGEGEVCCWVACASPSNICVACPCGKQSPSSHLTQGFAVCCCCCRRVLHQPLCHRQICQRGRRQHRHRRQLAQPLLPPLLLLLVAAAVCCCCCWLGAVCIHSWQGEEGLVPALTYHQQPPEAPAGNATAAGKNSRKQAQKRNQQSNKLPHILQTHCGKKNTGRSPSHPTGFTGNKEIQNSFHPRNPTMHPPCPPPPCAVNQRTQRHSLPLTPVSQQHTHTERTTHCPPPKAAHTQSVPLTAPCVCPRLAACCRGFSGRLLWLLHRPGRWGTCAHSRRGPPPACGRPVWGVRGKEGCEEGGGARRGVSVPVKGRKSPPHLTPISAAERPSSVPSSPHRGWACVRVCFVCRQTG